MADRDDHVSSQQLMKQLDKFHKEVVAYAEKTTANIETLKAATDLVNKQKDSKWAKFRTLMPIIIITLLIVLLFCMRPAGVCSLAFNTEKLVSLDMCEE